MTTNANSDLKVFMKELGPDSVGNDDMLLEFRSLAEKFFVSPVPEENTASLIRAQRKSSRKRVANVTTADATTAEPQRDSCLTKHLALEFAGSTASNGSESRLRPPADTEPGVAQAETPDVQSCELVLPQSYMTEGANHSFYFCRCESWSLSYLYYKKCN